MTPRYCQWLVGFKNDVHQGMIRLNCEAPAVAKVQMSEGGILAYMGGPELWVCSGHLDEYDAHMKDEE